MMPLDDALGEMDHALLALRGLSKMLLNLPAERTERAGLDCMPDLLWLVTLRLETCRDMLGEALPPETSREAA